MSDDAPKPFIDRVLQAIDDGFLAQIENEAGGVVMRIAGGATSDEAMKNFGGVLRLTIEAHAAAKIIAEHQVETMGAT